MNKYFICIVDSNAKTSNLVALKMEYVVGTTYNVTGNFRFPNFKEFATKTVSKAEILNGKLVDGRVESIGYNYKIFEEQAGNKPSIILNVIKDKMGNVLGYTILDTNNFKVANVQLKKALEIAELFNKHGLKAYQNAIYVPGSKDKRAHIKGHMCSFDEVIISTPKKNRASKVTQSKESVDAASKAVENKGSEESPFSKEQLKILKTAANRGLPYKKIANPKLTPEQMAILMEIEVMGFDCRYLADPDFKIDALKFYKAEVKNGADIRPYIDKRFNAAQLMQISEGVELGIDYKQYMNPDLDGVEMEEIKTRLRTEMWKGEIAFDDIINKRLRMEINKRKNDGFTKKAEEMIDKRNEAKKKKKA